MPYDDEMYGDMSVILTELQELRQTVDSLVAALSPFLAAAEPLMPKLHRMATMTRFLK